MKAIRILAIYVGALVSVANASADEPLSPEAKRGEAGFAACNSCHNPGLDPSLAPPMWGVQRRYMMTYQGRESFINAVAAFARQPDNNKAVMKRPVAVMGLMPAQELAEDTLRDIAAYIYETSFPPPCAHWASAIRKAQEQGQVDFHIRKDRMMMQRFCGE